MSESTKPTLNEAKCGNKSKPLLANRLPKFRSWDDKQKHMAIQGTPDLETLTSFMHHYSDSKFIMQSTGILDKNGVEIFEDDFLLDIEFYEEEGNISSKHLVVYDSENGIWCIDNSYKKDFSSLVPLVDYFGKENLEVYGNYFEQWDINDIPRQ
jgi:uncharacterized phage protein (TIGR01671 family)